MTRTEEFYSTVFSQLLPDSVLVTGNQRLARTLLQVFDQQKVDRGETVWESPAIVSWSTWVQQLWNGAILQNDSEDRILLSQHQEELVWQNIINRSPEASLLLQLNQVASRAYEAWNLAHQWYLALDSIDAETASQDCKIFMQWCQEYRDLCKTHRWLDSARLPDALTDFYRSAGVRAPARIVLLGFDEFTPQQQRLLDTMIELGSEMQQPDIPNSSNQAAHVYCNDRQAEYENAARWSLAKFLSAETSRIAVVVPDLEQQRNDITRIFDEVLCPEKLIDTGKAERLYNVSAGHTLVQHPVIETYLGLLDLVTGRLDSNKAGHLITSPFIAGAEEESNSRYQLDAVLRSVGEETVTLSTLQFYSSRLDENDQPLGCHCPILATLLQQWQAIIEQARGRHHPGYWSEFFTEVANAAGWPGTQQHDTEVSQCVRSWKDMLSQFTALQTVQPTFSFAEARQHLRRMAGRIMFQPRTSDSRVQVLGMMEASGLQFDALWICGLHDEVWPETPKPNPFLPFAEQKRIGMPHSGADRELQAAVRISNRLLASASEVVVSTARREGDAELRRSPLFSTAAQIDIADVIAQESDLYTRQIYRSGHRESLADYQAPVAQPGFVRGGSSLFRLMSACPFRAFAELRLGARGLDEVEPGLDAAERGQLIHRLLELFWKNVQTHQRLCAMSDQQLQANINKLVDEVIEEQVRLRPQTFTGRYREIETRRLRNYLQQWITVEKQRPDFSIAATEKQYQVVVAGITVEIMIDRIDRLPDDSLAVIDYKTGEVSPNTWFGERPDEPQLPLYTTHLGEDVSVVAFAQIKPGAMKYRGVGREKNMFPGVAHYEKYLAEEANNQWQSLLQQWQLSLQRLASEYLAGRADVDPKPNACDYCELASLCRISELEQNIADGQEVTL